MLTQPKPESQSVERSNVRTNVVTSGGWIRFAGRFVALLVLTGLVYGGYHLALPLVAGSKAVAKGLTYSVTTRNIIDTVVERGTIESQNTVHGRCELPGFENKIIWIVDEGALVNKGDIVVKFDSAEIDKEVAEKQSRLIEVEGKLEQAKQELEVQNNKNQSDIAAAELELTLADLDLKKYRDGDYIAEKSELERSISEGDAELKKATEEMTNMRALVRKGFRSPEQLRELELRVSSYESRVDRDKQKYHVLINYDHQRKITEFEAKARESKRKLERSQTTADAETKKAESAILVADRDVLQAKTELSELEKYKAHCEIIAPQAGTVAYANQEWFDPDERIREGATVRRQQDVFYLPDMSKMQVKVSVHESVVNKIRPGLRADVRVDAFPDSPVSGNITFVAELATSSFSNTKNYEVLVLIDKIPEGVSIKPGMTAQVDITIGVYDNAMAVPVGAITEHFQQSYIYVRDGLNVVRRKVTTGRSTHSFVEIADGVAEGEIVMLDAYQRGLSDFSQAERAAKIGQESATKPGDSGPVDEGSGATSEESGSVQESESPASSETSE